MKKVITIKIPHVANIVNAKIILELSPVLGISDNGVFSSISITFLLPSLIFLLSFGISSSVILIGVELAVAVYVGFTIGVLLDVGVGVNELVGVILLNEVVGVGVVIGVLVLVIILGLGVAVTTFGSDFCNPLNKVILRLPLQYCQLHA